MAAPEPVEGGKHLRRAGKPPDQLRQARRSAAYRSTCTKSNTAFAIRAMNQDDTIADLLAQPANRVHSLGVDGGDEEIRHGSPGLPAGAISCNLHGCGRRPRGKKGRIDLGEVIPAGSQLPRGLAFASTRSTPRQSKKAQTSGGTATTKPLPGAATVHSTAPSTARPR